MISAGAMAGCVLRLADDHLCATTTISGTKKIVSRKQTR